MNPILERLTPRQREVFLGRMKGQGNAEIARSLHIALNTVKVLEMQIRERFDAEGSGWGWWLVAARAYERGELAAAAADLERVTAGIAALGQELRSLTERVERLQQPSVACGAG